MSKVVGATGLGYVNLSMLGFHRRIIMGEHWMNHSITLGHKLGRALALGYTLLVASMSTAADKPNIVVIMGDDIGISNISYISHGMMGYKTPNIDRIAREGMFMTDYYAEQSCTAGRAAFITGQSPVRTGLTKVGIPGSPLGISKKDPTLAELLKPHGYMTGQFGKNHLGDRDEYLPTNHGFDEFFGNLYHLNAEEEPENPNYPKDPAFVKMFSPRGVIHSYADGRIEDSGPLTKKRMETVDDEFLAAALKFVDKAHQDDKPFLLWFNSTRMHYNTHVPDSYSGRSGLNFYADGMLQHDDMVGVLLDRLDELKLTDNTIVIYTTDNGPHLNEWPDAGISPFRGEKNTNWEGGFRVPTFVRWPNKIAAGSISNSVMSHQDWVPTLMAAVGDDNIKEKLKQGHRAGSSEYKVHLDGYNMLPHLMGEEETGRRKNFFYFSDDGLLIGLRYADRWKLVFAEQRAKQMQVWREPFIQLRIPLIFDLRMDPYERAQHNANQFNHWQTQNQFLAMPSIPIVFQFVATFKEFPPRQKPASFNVEDITAAMYQYMQK
jgi:arylsulfatase A-like enzyme